MYKTDFNEALELGANRLMRCGNGWWRVEFICADTAQFFLAYAKEQPWTVIGSGLVFGVRL